MSGTNAPPNVGPHDSSGGADPSMEDILASIRRILNEDEVAPASPAAPGGDHAGPVVEHEMPNAGGSGGDDGVLVLDEAMLVPMPGQPTMQPAPVAAPPAPAPAPPMFATSSAIAAPVSEPAHGGIMDPDSAAAATASVGALLRQLSSERSTQVHRGGPTIEDLVREEVRPLLKSWLDAHLPPLVERLVRQEIERVTGRALS